MPAEHARHTTGSQPFVRTDRDGRGPKVLLKDPLDLQHALEVGPVAQELVPLVGGVVAGEL